MQRTAEDIHEDCRRIADVAAPDDSIARIAEKTPELSHDQVARRLAAMRRDLGLDPAEPRAIHEPQHRAGAVAQRWRRHCL
ncbi:MAG: hypothetical protein JNL82_14400 [Myxococcales bacterium]|nr:hypothetical protein [Myxococcales bacterium]